jgi:multicomponent Na+:H+ antiporter subunit E
MKKIAVFAGSFVVWVLLVWPFEAGPGGAVRVQGQDLVAGLLVALVVAGVMRGGAARPFRLWLNPARYVWLALYGAVLAYYVVRANVDVAYRLLHPAMPIKPGIVRIRSSLTNPAALTALANSITLTPGTLTVSAAEDGVLYVHCINLETTDEETLSQRIAGRFEWFLKRIFG